MMYCDIRYYQCINGPNFYIKYVCVVFNSHPQDLMLQTLPFYSEPQQIEYSPTNWLLCLPLQPPSVSTMALVVPVSQFTIYITPIVLLPSLDGLGASSS